MRKAFGPQRIMSPREKARNVAESIIAHGLDLHAERTLERYGLRGNLPQQMLVREAITALQEGRHRA